MNNYYKIYTAAGITGIIVLLLVLLKKSKKDKHYCMKVPEFYKSKPFSVDDATFSGDLEDE